MQLKGWSICRGFRWSVCSEFDWSACRGFRWSLYADFPLNEKTSPFDTFAQIIDGSANMVIDGVATMLQTGQGIIIPAHSSSHIKPNGRFKILLTVIKSGYE